MTPKSQKKGTIDWYFSRVHGRVFLAASKNSKQVEVMNSAQSQGDNVEARHRSAWRRQTRRFFAALLMGAFGFQMSAFAAQSELSSDTRAKAAQKAQAKAEIAAKAKKTYPKEAKKSEMTVSGTVVSVRKSGISLEVGQSEEAGAEEVLLSLSEDLKFSNVASAKDLKYGDLVEVKFVQIYLPAKLKNENPSVLDSKALEIRLVEKASDRIAAAAATAGVPA